MYQKSEPSDTREIEKYDHASHRDIGKWEMKVFIVFNRNQFLCMEFCSNKLGMPFNLHLCYYTTYGHIFLERRMAFNVSILWVQTVFIELFDIRQSGWWLVFANTNLKFTSGKLNI